jgi:phenylalanyl-tRNA synthetase alpha chain
MNTTQLDSTLNDAKRLLAEVQTLAELEDWYLRYFSRERGELNQLTREIPKLPPEERKPFGQEVNRIKGVLQEHFDARKRELESAELTQKLGRERIDVTLPGRAIALGHPHPLTRVLESIIGVFSKLGYHVAEGPEVEDDWHNFTALNTPEDHPAREMQDTFYVEGTAGAPGARLLRTHTSPVQIRVMEAQKPPIRIIAPGRVYRRDTVTNRHYPIFHQIEGLVIDQETTFADLKGTLTLAMQEVFGKDRKVRFRPSFFPFTEPSAEYDIQCICQGEGCRLCSHTGWLEIGGCGMVDPSVLQGVGLDPDVYQGFAFGLGAERIALLKYDIPDIRLIWENDLRFLRQF